MTSEPGPMDPYAPIAELPPLDVRVIVTRKSGKELAARRGYKFDSIFRDPTTIHWLDDNGKFADVAFDPIVSWRPAQ